MRAAGSCGDQSGRTSAPIRPQAVHTILGHKDPHRHFVRQPIGIHDGAVVAPARGAVDEQIAAAVTAYVTERDGLKGLAAARGMRPHQFSPVCGLLLKLMLCRRNMASTGVLLLI